MTPLIVGLAGPSLSADEAAFLRDARPVGVILFRRNVGEADTLRRLVAAASEAAGTRLVLADQEGGRVQRLLPPLAPRYPAAALIGEVFARDREKGRRGAWLAGRLIASDLAAFGITVPCLPVADVRAPRAHDVIGDRSYSGEPAGVAVLARAAADGVRAGGAVPVAKHIPGHGRATADSHVTLPRVDADRAALEDDAGPFRALADLPAAMTAHVVYAALDTERPATLSPSVVRFIRSEIGFGGLLLTDDICMGALSGDRAGNAAAAVAAGCDVVVHCSGDLVEMQRVAAALPTARGETRRRIAAAQPASAEPADLAGLRTEFAELVGTVGATAEARAAAGGADPTRMAS